jgi:hypothetical protein
MNREYLPFIMEHVIGKPFTPPELLEGLNSRCSYLLAPWKLHEADKVKAESAKCYVAANPGASYEILRTLASDPSYMVRMLVAQNPSTPDDLLEVLAGDADTSVRSVVETRAGSFVRPFIGLRATKIEGYISTS